MSKIISSTNIKKGMLWSGIASLLWGISGTIMQFVSNTEQINPNWFLATRTFATGVILIPICLIMYGTKETFHVFSNWKKTLITLAYGIFGLGSNLYCFYLGVQTGTSSATTILQYLAPLFIVIANFLFFRQRPSKQVVISFIVALVGTFFAITGGNINTMVIPLNSLIWGILSGLTAALYVMLPAPLIHDQENPMVVLGWGSLIASVPFNIMHPFWKVPSNIVSAHGKINIPVILAIAAIIIVGTLLAFACLLHALKFAPSSVVSITDALQPATTFVLSIIFFKQHFTFVELLGTLIILIAIYALEKSSNESEKIKEQIS